MKRIVIASLLALASFATPARADDEEGARGAMRRGVAAFGRGEAQNALEEYETAKRLAPQANAPYLYAAEALVALQRYPEAVTNLETYLAKSPNVSDAEEVRARIQRIKAEHYPGRVKIQVESNAVVAVDGVDRGAVRTVEIAPGKHRFDIRAPEKRLETRDVEVVGATEQTLVIELVPEPKSPDPPPSAATPSSFSEPTIWPAVGWVTVGVGGAALLASIVVDGAVLGPKVSDYDDAATRRDPSARALRDDAKGLQSLTLAGYIAGGVITAAGVGILLFAPRTTEAAKPSARIVPLLGPSMAGVGIGGAL